MLPNHEIDRIRLDNIDLFKKNGLALVVRQVWTPFDYEQGLVGHCTTCWKPAYKQASDADCPECYGTGFSGGYRDPVFTWGTVAFQNFGYEGGANDSGWFEKEGGAFGSMCFTPLINEADLVWTVTSYSDGEATGVAELWQVTGNITRYTLRGPLHTEDGGVFNFEGSLLSQSFGCQVLPDNDYKWRYLSYNSSGSTGASYDRSALRNNVDAHLVYRRETEHSVDAEVVNPP